MINRDTRSERGAWWLRLSWYALATILILTLPTFSDRSQPLPSPQPTAAPGGQEPGAESSDVPPAPVTSRIIPVPSAASGPTSEVPRTSSARRERPSLSPAVRSESSVAALARRQSTPSPRAAVTPDAPAVSTSPAEAPQGFSPLDSFRSNAVPLPGGGAAALQAGLEEIDQGYQQAYANLFPEVASGVTFPGQQNPFEEAAAGAQTDPGTSDSPDSSTNPSDPGDAPEPEVNTGDAPPGGGGGEGTPPEPNPGVEDVPPPRPLYNFLVVGDVQGNGSLVSRANLLGNTLVLENSFEISFFPGSLHVLIVFTEGERLFTTDLNGDGSTDFVLIRVVPAVGSSVESYLQVAPGRFELHGSAGLYLEEVTALALYDVTGDEQDELVLLKRDSDHLFVYELRNRDWTYLYELVLPFSPSTLMVSAAGAPLGTRLLYVVDDSLRYVVNLSSRRPDRLRFGSRAPLNHLSTVTVDWLGAGEQPMLIFGLQDVLLLAEQRGGALETVAGFDTRSRVPVVILGDYLGIGERQLLWVP